MQRPGESTTVNAMAIPITIEPRSYIGTLEEEPNETAGPGAAELCET